MRHFVFVGDQREVLGVWVADDIVAATRLRLELELTYPDCVMRGSDADDYETFKASHTEYEFGDIEPSAPRER